MTRSLHLGLVVLAAPMMTGCLGALFSAQAVADKEALKTSKTVLVTDAYVVESYAYYKGEQQCGDTTISLWDGGTDLVTKAVERRLEAAHSGKLGEAFTKLATSHLKQGCMTVDTFSALAASAKSWHESNEGKLAFAELAAKAGQQAGKPYDLVSRAYVNITFSDPCGNKAMQSYPQCQPGGSITPTVAFWFEVVDVAGKRNAPVYFNMKLYGVGFNPSDPFYTAFKGSKATSLAKLNAEQKTALKDAVNKVAGDVMKEFGGVLTEVVVENKSIPPVSEIDAKLSF